MGIRGRANFKGHLFGPLSSLGYHFRHLILELGMILEENVEEIMGSWAALATENYLKVTHLILCHFLLL